VNQATVSGGGDATPENNTASDPTRTTGPDYRMVKTHVGNFRQGQVQAVYQLQVLNVGSGGLGAPVVVTDEAPAGLTVVGMSGGPGWSCTAAPARCVSTGATLGGPISVYVNVAANAPATLTNVARVIAADDVNGTNDRAEDVTVIESAAPDLRVNKSHAGSFVQGQRGATYALAVFNSGQSATTGAVTVTDLLPSGLTAVGLGGSGWSCTLATLSCTRSDALAAGASYPAVTVTVDVSATAPAQVVNQAVVAGGGETNTTNNVSSDNTVVAASTLNVTVAQGAATLNRATGRYQQNVTITNNGAALSASALVLDSLGAGLTLFNATGLTAATAPAGSPYVEAGPIGAGASVVVRLEFVRAVGAAISYSPRVLGAGPR